MSTKMSERTLEAFAIAIASWHRDVSESMGFDNDGGVDMVAIEETDLWDAMHKTIPEQIADLHTRMYAIARAANK